MRNVQLFAFAHPFNYFYLLAHLEEMGAKRTTAFSAACNEDKDLCKVANGKTLEPLKVCGKQAFTDLEVSLREYLLR